MKIAIFSQRWITGGKEAFIVNMLEKIDLNNLEVVIVTSYKETSFFDKQLENINISIVELLDKKYNFFKRNLFIRKKLNLFLKKNHFDKIIFNIDNGWDLNLLKIAKKNNVKKVVAHSHNSDVSYDKFRFIKLFAHTVGKTFYSSAPTEYWACSNKAARFIFNNRHNEKRHFDIIKNGIETDKYIFSEIDRKEIRKKLNISESQILVGTVGRLSEQKNPDFIINIAKHFHSNINYKFIFIGEGEMIKSLKQKASQYGIENNIIFFGKSNNVASMMSAMDIFLLPSKFEGLPITLIEAQTNGLPILVSNRVTKEVKISDNIKFLPIEDEILWCKEIEKISLNYNRKMYMQKIREAGYDINTTSKKYLRLILE